MRRWPRYPNRYSPRTSYRSYDSGFTMAPTYQSPSPFQNGNSDNSLNYPSNANAIQGQLTPLQNSVLTICESLKSLQKDVDQGFTIMSEDILQMYQQLESSFPSGSEPMAQFTPENLNQTYTPPCTSVRKTIIENSIPPTLSAITGDVMNTVPYPYTSQSLRTQQQEALSIGAMQSEISQLKSPLKPKERASVIEKHKKSKLNVTIS